MSLGKWDDLKHRKYNFGKVEMVCIGENEMRGGQGKRVCCITERKREREREEESWKVFSGMGSAAEPF